jgi:hypothetical protein
LKSLKLLNESLILRNFDDISEELNYACGRDKGLCVTYNFLKFMARHKVVREDDGRRHATLTFVDILNDISVVRVIKYLPGKELVFFIIILRVHC